MKDQNSPVHMDARTRKTICARRSVNAAAAQGSLLYFILCLPLLHYQRFPPDMLNFISLLYGKCRFPFGSRPS